MTNPWIKKIQKQTGKSEEVVAALWEKAKEIASDSFNLIEDSFSEKQYKYAYQTVINMLEKKDKRVRPIDFIESSKGAKEFIKELVTSDQFDIPNSLVLSPDDIQNDYAEDDEADGMNMTDSEPEGSYSSDFDNPQVDLPDREGRNDGGLDHDWEPISNTLPLR